MPELPELTVVREVLQRRIIGYTIESIEFDPSGAAIVVRDLTRAGFSQVLTGATITEITRRGKFLVFSLELAWAFDSGHSAYLVINPKLTGRLQLTHKGEKRYAKTHVVFSLSGGDELRYIDQKRMGQVYLTIDLSLVPEFSGMGPEPFDLSLDEFRARLRPYRGEIKGILTRGEFVAGIGNAYADEILWDAGIYPFRIKTSLKEEEIERLYRSMQSVLRQATDQVRIEMGENIYLKPRDFLSVHMKTDEPCPRCGTPISLVGANQRITNFCRHCQPGGMIRGMS